MANGIVPETGQLVVDALLPETGQLVVGALLPETGQLVVATGSPPAATGGVYIPTYRRRRR